MVIAAGGESVRSNIQMAGPAATTNNNNPQGYLRMTSEQYKDLVTSKSDGTLNLVDADGNPAPQHHHGEPETGW